jgi:hypothetical protein
LVAAQRAKYLAKNYVPNSRGVPRNTARKNRDGITDPRKNRRDTSEGGRQGTKFEKHRTNPNTHSLAAVQAEQQGSVAASKAQKRAPSRDRDQGRRREDRRQGEREDHGREDHRREDRNRQGRDKPRPLKNKKLTQEEVDELRDQGRCFWCFQEYCDCRKSWRNGKCKFYGVSRPWEK